MGGGGSWGCFEPVSFLGVTSSAVLCGIQMRAEHDSKKEFVERVNPLLSLPLRL